ncbi:MAG: LysE family transporter [Alphaproteobacteria bacterium]|jgi:threonine/homoserine/homoserine lactone efflux protein|nr:LysE family transporter [Alphaproteobacteria bacterium]
MTLPELLLFLFPLAYSPGPGNLFFAAIGARSGWRATLPAFIGYHLATLIAALAVGAGVFLASRPIVSTALTLAGTGYMLWLAWKLWHAGAAQGRGGPTGASFTDGAALLALNPKAWAIMAALFALYPDADLPTTLRVAAIFTLNNLVAFAVWTMAGQALLGQSRHVALMNRGFALLLAAVALHMALT